MAGLVPPALLALFGLWCGTFAWGATSPAAVAAALSSLGILLWIGVPWQDPLRLGGPGRLLPAALWITTAASAWASPVSRAGWVAVILMPAFLALPAAVEHCWRLEADRRWGLRALALTVAAVCLWAFLDWWGLGTPRPAMPLGHHNLLAAWLVILLPLAVLPAREPGAWRLAGWLAGGLAVLTVFASRSLAGFAALFVEALVGFGGQPRIRQRRWWAVLLALALLVAFLQLPRVLRIAGGEDPSARARSSYWAAGMEGLRSRPLLGWGPGAAAWTSAAFLVPAPGVNPWGEAVGELHSLPVQLGYELGVTGLLLALGLTALFFLRRIAEREEGRDPQLLACALLGLGGGAVSGLGSGAIAVVALPLAAAVAAGAALAGSGRGRVRRASRLPARIYSFLALLALAPLELARWHYDRAVAADQQGQRRRAEAVLRKAMRLDPKFPLYPMRLALLQEDKAVAAELALRAAAEEGRAVPALWLVAGALGHAAELPSAGRVLDQACALDPLGPFPPFYRMLAGPSEKDAAAYGAHALLAEPRLAAAVFWERHPALLAETLQTLRRWPAVDAGWKQKLIDSVPAANLRQGPFARMELLIDTSPRESLSLPVFRRRRWPSRWPLVQVRQSAAAGLTLTPATAWQGTSALALTSAPCMRRSLRGRALLTR